MNAETWMQLHVTGHAGIDAQHHMLFRILEQTQRTLANPNINDHRQVVLDLMKYVVEHFNYELNLMRQHDYPDLVLHHTHHQEMIGDLLRLKKTVFSDQMIGNELETFLLHWIEHHIDHQDCNLAGFLKGKGVDL